MLAKSQLTLLSALRPMAKLQSQNHKEVKRYHQTVQPKLFHIPLYIKNTHVKFIRPSLHCHISVSFLLSAMFVLVENKSKQNSTTYRT